MNLWQIGAPIVAMALGGCSLTVPVAVIASDGEVLKGTATASAIGGSSFVVYDQRTTCYGSFDGVTPVPTVSFATHCTDGRTGVGMALRNSRVSGSGTIALSDGTTARFIFGPGAAGF